MSQLGQPQRVLVPSTHERYRSVSTGLRLLFSHRMVDFSDELWMDKEEWMMSKCYTEEALMKVKHSVEKGRLLLTHKEGSGNTENNILQVSDAADGSCDREASPQDPRCSNPCCDAQLRAAIQAVEEATAAIKEVETGFKSFVDIVSNLQLRAEVKEFEGNIAHMKHYRRKKHGPQVPPFLMTTPDNSDDDIEQEADAMGRAQDRKDLRNPKKRWHIVHPGVTMLNEDKTGDVDVEQDAENLAAQEGCDEGQPSPSKCSRRVRFADDDTAATSSGAAFSSAT